MTDDQAEPPQEPQDPSKLPPLLQQVLHLAEVEAVVGLARAIQILAEAHGSIEGGFTRCRQMLAEIESGYQLEKVEQEIRKREEKGDEL